MTSTLDQDPVPPQRQTRGFLALIYINAFLTGAIIMAFEMLGSRYLNPYFGSGIFTWASLISTILLALSLGYLFGGWIADRMPRTRVLGGLIILSSLYLLAFPYFAREVSEAVVLRVEDVRLGSLLASLILMTFPVAVMGVYSPFAIRLVLTDTGQSGRVAGRIFGVSTMGSIVGTLVTAFWLVPVMGSNAITLLLGCCGLASGLSFVITAPWFRQTGAAVIGAVIGTVGVMALLALAASPMARAAGAPLDKARLLALPDQVIEQIESEYNNIFITKRGNLLTMSFRRFGREYTESSIDLRHPDALPAPYTRFMTVGLLYAQNHKTMAMIGLGGGATSVYLVKHIPTLQADVVELDPGVIRAARKYFGVGDQPRLNIVASDGRVFMFRQRKQYDMILIDAFRGGYVPFHLLTREFYSLLKKRLNPGGVAVFNIHAGTKLFPATLNTLAGVFDSLELYPTDAGNVIVVAFMGPVPMPKNLLRRAIALQSDFGFPYSLPLMLERRRSLPKLPATRPLTDDFAPANYLKAIKSGNKPKW